MRAYEASRLDERARAALRLADAYMTDPGGIGPDLRSAVRTHFTAAETVELTADVLAFSLQKVTVALGIDAPVDPERLTPLAFDGAGRSVIG